MGLSGRMKRATNNLAGKPPLGLKPDKVAKDPVRLAAVAQLPCCICGARPVHVHHCISGRYSQRKAPDSMTIPLCWNHHQGPEGIHADKRAWEARWGPDTGFLAKVNRLLERMTLPY
jgi:hypothetical protein